MGKTLSVAEAKATFSACIRKVEAGGAVMITRHGKTVAALVPSDKWEHLERLRKAGPETGLAAVAGGWEGSDELADLVDKSFRRGRRSVPKLES